MTLIDRRQSAGPRSSGDTTSAPGLWRLVEHGPGPCRASQRLVTLAGDVALPVCPDCGWAVSWEPTTYAEAFPGTDHA